MKANDYRFNAYKKASELKDGGIERNPVSDNADGDLAKDGLNVGASIEGSEGSNTHFKINNPKLIKTVKRDEKYDPSKDSIYRRVAKFLLLIGIDEAAKILPHLTQEQTEKIIPEIASVRYVDPDEATVILAEFDSLLQKSREEGGVTTARSILVKAFGEQRAEEMLNKAVPYTKHKPFDYMSEMDSDRIYYLIKDEYSAVRALVLSQLNPKVSAEVIGKLPQDEKTELIRRLASLTKIDPEVLHRVDEAMYEKVKNVNTSNSDTIDGRNALAEILKKMSMNSEREILSMLENQDPELTSDLKQRLFTEEDFINCDDRYLQDVLRKMEEVKIAFLIGGKSEKFRSKILSNVSKGKGDIILEEEQLHKPMLKKEVDDVTNEFMASLRQKWEAGELFINGRDGEVYV